MSLCKTGPKCWRSRSTWASEHPDPFSVCAILLTHSTIFLVTLKTKCLWFLFFFSDWELDIEYWYIVNSILSHFRNESYGNLNHLFINHCALYYYFENILHKQTYVQNSLRSRAFLNLVSKAGMHCSPKYPIYVILSQWYAVKKTICIKRLQCLLRQRITFMTPP